MNLNTVNCNHFLTSGDFLQAFGPYKNVMAVQTYGRATRVCKSWHDYFFNDQQWKDITYYKVLFFNSFERFVFETYILGWSTSSGVLKYKITDDSDATSYRISQEVFEDDSINQIISRARGQEKAGDFFLSNKARADLFELINLFSTNFKGILEKEVTSHVFTNTVALYRCPYRERDQKLREKTVFEIAEMISSYKQESSAKDLVEIAHKYEMDPYFKNSFKDKIGFCIRSLIVLIALPTSLLLSSYVFDSTILNAIGVVGLICLLKMYFRSVMCWVHS